MLFFCAPVLWSFEVFSIMKENMRKNTEAVSPVVGVMLMLVVTIIIAAVVSAFAGGMASNQQKAPSGDFECKIANSGSWGSSYFDMKVLAVSEPIPTKDIKITTSWKASDGTTNGTTITGPAPGNGNTHYGTYHYHSPLGFGPNMDWVASGQYKPDQDYGNYTLLAGTVLHNSAAGYSAPPSLGGKASGTGGYGVDPSLRWEYTVDGTYSQNGYMDAMRAMLGWDWEHLRPGDKVNVKMTHIPTGAVIFEKDVVVEG